MKELLLLFFMTYHSPVVNCGECYFMFDTYHPSHSSIAYSIGDVHKAYDSVGKFFYTTNSNWTGSGGEGFQLDKPLVLYGSNAIAFTDTGTHEGCPSVFNKDEIFKTCDVAVEFHMPTAVTCEPMQDKGSYQTMLCYYEPGSTEAPARD